MAKRKRRGYAKGKFVKKTEYIPQDVVMRILARLPPKSLARFRCVNRSFCSSLNDSKFLTKLAIQESQNPEDHKNHKFLCSSYADYSIYEVGLNETEDILGHLFHLRHPDKPVKLEHPLLRNEYNEYNIVGSCNGLLCMVDSAKEFLLLNPLTGDGRRLSRPKWLQSCSVFIGFGCDVSNELDHKIVRIEDRSSRLVVDIFSMKNDCWKTIELRLPSTTSMMGMGAIHVNGILYWKELDNNDTLIPFNLGEDKFGELIKIPKGNYDPLQNYYSRIIGISVLQGCLCVAHIRNGYYTVWLMKKNGIEVSWTNFVTIKSRDFVVDILTNYTCPVPPPLCYTKDGRVVIVLDYNCSILIYNSTDESFSITHSRDSVFRSVEWVSHRIGKSEYRFFGWVPYVASLVSPYSMSKQDNE